MTSIVGAILILAGFVGTLSVEPNLGTLAIIVGAVYLVIGIGVEMAKIMAERDVNKPN